MKETDQLRKLMESIDHYDWKTMYVYDSSEPEVSEVNVTNELEMARFNEKYGFDADSIFDFPVERGVRSFELHNVNPPKTVIVSNDIQSLAAEVEARSSQQ